MATNSYFNENTIEELLDEIKYVYQSDKRPWVIGYSGGKDSTTVVELVYKMLLSLPEEERKKSVYIVSSDTLIENPIIKIYLNKMNNLLGEAAKRDHLPIISTMVTPPADNSFWANVIGRGFPTPRMNGTFRWCTDRLKINPSADYIRNVIKQEGEEVVVLLGVRKAESEARKRRIEGRELANRLMNRHESIQEAYVYNPIVELTTEDVWDVLLKLDGGKTPWGSNNNELVALYSDADSGECPFAGMHAGGQTQTCGNSRFGCWVCTVVKDDKSLNGFIKSGHRELIPLAEFRSWIMSIRDRDVLGRLENINFQDNSNHAVKESVLKLFVRLCWLTKGRQDLLYEDRLYDLDNRYMEFALGPDGWHRVENNMGVYDTKKKKVFLGPHTGGIIEWSEDEIKVYEYSELGAPEFFQYYINSKGEVLYPGLVNKGFNIVERPDKYGFAVVAIFEVNETKRIGSGFLGSDGKHYERIERYGVANLAGELVIPAEYDMIYEKEAGNFICRKDGQEQMISLKKE